MWAVFVGEVEEKEAVESLLAGSDVHYLGMLPREDIAAKMVATDIFLFSSTRKGESLAVVLVEAIFSGAIPVVIGNSAVREAIPPQYHSLLISNAGQSFQLVLENVLNLTLEQRKLISKELRHWVAGAYEKTMVSCNLTKSIKELLYA